jgi:hypothetical protein
MSTIEYFNSNKDYKRYLEMKGLAEQVNDFIGKGYLVLDDGKSIIEPFVFSLMGEEPEIAYKASNTCLITYLGTYSEKTGKLIVEADDLISFKKMIKKFSVINPNDIKRIKISPIKNQLLTSATQIR